ncbi:MAG: hypothetical protein BWX90_01071 [bacterium ADurb.Bin132]|nr:MAG: hypothetical protein BWX90_01071 [bacterium ADurb.Bin132]
MEPSTPLVKSTGFPFWSVTISWKGLAGSTSSAAIPAVRMDGVGVMMREDAASALLLSFANPGNANIPRTKASEIIVLMVFIQNLLADFKLNTEKAP